VKPFFLASAPRIDSPVELGAVFDKLFDKIALHVNLIKTYSHKTACMAHQDKVKPGEAIIFWLQPFM
jgi:hypothetical protein